MIMTISSRSPRLSRLSSLPVIALLLAQTPILPTTAAAATLQSGTSSAKSTLAPRSVTPSTGSKQSLAESGTPIINEVAPASASGKAPWIEIRVQSLLTTKLYLPILAHGNSAAIAALPPVVASGVTLAGYTISDEDGHSYTLPATLPPLPPDGFVLIQFDTGTDDLDIGDGTAVLHATTMSGGFEADGDQIALRNASGQLVDFVAWGKDAAEDDDVAVTADKWNDGQYLIYDQGFGGEVALSPQAAGQSFGLFENAWVSYRAAASTPGHINPLPTPMGSTIPDGGAVSGETFGVAWTAAPNAIGYDFDLATTSDFSPTLVHTRTVYPGWHASGIQPAGVYYWRARTVAENGSVSGYLGPAKLESVLAPVAKNTGLPSAPNVSKQLLSTSNYRIQRKDTTMLDIGGGTWNVDSKGKLFGLPRLGEPNRWNGPHVEAGTQKPLFSFNGYDNMMCVRASTSMLNSYYGGSLPIDRLSYQMFEASSLANNQVGVPEGDLGFNKGIGSTTSQKYIISWALGVTPETLQMTNHCPDPFGAGIKGYDSDEDYTCPAGSENAGKISFSFVRDLIDTGRPFASINLKNAHMRVVDGYRYTNPNLSDVEIHIADPVPNGSCEGPGNFCTVGARWEAWKTFQNTVERSYAVPVTATVKAGKAESSLNKDSDNDGVNDFDETRRFYTDPFDEDTDGDGLKDREDIAYYVFHNSDKYNKFPADIPFVSQQSPNPDGKRMELDPDNDKDGALDGCEDANRNGKLDGVESSNLVQGNTTNGCRPDLEMVYPLNNMADDIGPINKPSPLLVRVQLHLPEAYPAQVYAKNQFKVFIEQPSDPKSSKPATITTFYQPFDDQVNLIVTLPKQTVAGKYAVRVQYNTNENISAVDGIKYTALEPQINVGVAWDTSLANPLHPLTVPVPSGHIDAFTLFEAQLPPDSTIGLITTGGSQTATLVLPQTVTSDQRGNSAGLAAFATSVPTGTNFMGSGLQAAQNQLTQTGTGPEGSNYLIALNGSQPNRLALGVQCPPNLLSSENTCPPVSTPTNPTRLLAIDVGDSQAGFHRLFGDVSGDNSLYRHTPLSLTLDGMAIPPEWVVADQLLHAADDLLNQQRIDEGFGSIAFGASLTREIAVQGDAVVFNSLFNRSSQWEMSLLQPDNSPLPLNGANVTSTVSTTFMRVRVAQPMPGLWKLVLRNTASAGGALGFATFSAGSTPLVGLLLPAIQKVREAAVRSPTTGQPLTLGLALLDGETPISGALIQVLVVRPNAVTQTTRLLDRGAGIYTANPFTPTIDGAYHIRIVASGSSNGQPFTRFVQDTVVTQKPIAYIYDENADLDEFVLYRNLLANAGTGLVALPRYGISATQLSQYRGFIIAADIGGANSTWASVAERNTLNTSGLPILGLGEGGYSLFNGLGLNLGSANTISRTTQMTQATAFAPAASVWSQPFTLAGASPFAMFDSSAGLRVNLGSVPPSGLDFIGLDTNLPSHVNIGRENTRFVLWGFYNGPLHMTENGKRAFINLSTALFE